LTEEELEELLKKEVKSDDIINKKLQAKTYDEEFDPYYFYNQIEPTKIQN